MLGYEEFKNGLLKETGKILGDRYAVTMSEVRKVNLGLREALEIFDRETLGNQPNAIYYFRPYYEKYKDGGTLHGIAGEIAEIQRKLEQRTRKTAEAIKDITDFEKCRGRLYFRMVNTDRNREFLENVPHWEMLDLSAVPYILFRESAETTESTAVYSSMVKKWGIPAEEVMGQAYKNAPVLMPAGDVSSVREMLGNSGMPSTAGRVPELCLLTNIKKMHGFSVVFYPGVLKSAADRLGQDFYILSSSVHEALIVPESMGMPPHELKEMVVKVNREGVEETEVLSDNIYFYDREKDELRMEGGGIWNWRR